MTFEKTYLVRDNKLTIHLPKEFTSKKRTVKQTILFIIFSKTYCLKSAFLF